MINTVRPPSGSTDIRKYWFGSYQGNDVFQFWLEDLLRRQGFEPVLFRKRKGREKGVDIALTMEMLVNAFNQNYDIALLFAGDEDYLGLVKEVKRYGPIVSGAYIKQGLSNRLRLAFDHFEYLNPNNINPKNYDILFKKIKAEGKI